MSTENNPTIETWIDSYDIDGWKLERIPLAAIDAGESERNQARATPIDSELVARYGEALIHGAHFPPLVVRPHRSGYAIIDGNNRYHAMKLQKGTSFTHPMYVVDGPPLVLALMAKSANTTNGMPLTFEERKAHAVQMSRQGIMTNRQIAAQCGLSANQVGEAVAVVQARKRATDKRSAARVSDNSMRRIGAIHIDGALDLLVANQVSKTPIPSKSVSDLIAKTRKVGSEAEVLAMVHAAIEEAQSAPTKIGASANRKLSDVAKLNNAISKIEGVNPLNVRVDPLVRPAMVDRIHEIVGRLNLIAESI